MKRREREHQEAGVGLATSDPSYKLKLDRAYVHLDSLNRAVERSSKHELNRVDKHRKLNLVTAALTRNTALVNASKSFTIRQPGPVEDGAQLLRWQAPRGNSKKESQPHAKATFNVVLAKAPSSGTGS